MGETVAVIGLGAMGGRAATKLAEAGHRVRGYDPAAEARDAARANGVDPHDSPETALSDARIVLLSLPMPSDVTTFASEFLAGLDSDAVVVDLSTIDPDSAKQAAASIGGSYLDAPVLGRPDRCGHWTLTVGGDSEAVRRVQPLLENTVAATVAHIGEVGSGSVVKLLNNLMFGAINAVTAEALNVSRRCGVDPETFARVVADSGAATVSGLFRELGTKIPAADFSPTFGLGLLHKDNRLAVDLAESTGSPAFVAHCVDQINTLSMGKDSSHADTAIVYRLYELLSANERADGARD